MTEVHLITEQVISQRTSYPSYHLLHKIIDTEKRFSRVLSKDLLLDSIYFSLCLARPDISRQTKQPSNKYVTSILQRYELIYSFSCHLKNAQ